MKNILILFFSMLCFSLAGQPAITLKPGTTDTARWELTRTFENGTSQVYFEPYDTLPNVIDFGKTLFYEGGFIGGARISQHGDYWTEQVNTFVRNQGLPIDGERGTIVGELSSFGTTADYVITYDTVTNSSIIGTWGVASASCGMPNDTIIVSVTGPDSLRLISAINPEFAPFPFSTVLNIGQDVVSLTGQAFGQIVTITKTNDNLWEGPFGCDWIRIE